MIDARDLRVGDQIHYNELTHNEAFHGAIGKITDINLNYDLCISSWLARRDKVCIGNRPLLAQLDHAILTPEVLFRL